MLLSATELDPAASAATSLCDPQPKRNPAHRSSRCTPCIGKNVRPHGRADHRCARRSPYRVHQSWRCVHPVLHVKSACAMSLCDQRKQLSLSGTCEGIRKCPSSVAHREPAALPRHPVLQQDDSAAPFAVGQKTALEAFSCERLDFDDVEPSAQFLDRHGDR
jgi:hypothetical protein